MANDFKVAKAGEGVDWESIKTKYSDIFDLYIAALPDDESGVTKSFPHKKEDITKQILTSKLKAIRLKYRQAVDSGRRSGHGRVVMIYYEMCQKVWGGSPATKQIDGGIESVELIPDADMFSSTNPSDGSVPPSGITQLEDEVQVPDEIDKSDGNGYTKGNSEASETSTQATVWQRREVLDNKLKSYRHEKMKRKLPVDTQLLGCAQEEIALKKQLMDQVDKMDQRYADNMERMSRNMERLTESIAEGFGLLKHLMLYQQPPGIYHPPLYNPYMQGSPHSSSTRMPSYPSSSHKSSPTPASPSFDFNDN